VTAVGHELRILPELLEFLDSRGIRYEVLDGCVVVTPPATFGHEDVAGAVFAQLWAAAPAELAVLGSSFGFWYDEPSYVMPDITVARRADCDPDGTRVAPLLVVEVLSSSTRRRDLLGKKSLYAEAGVPSYWIVEPEEPSLTVLTLRDGDYIETAQVRGSEELAVADPFPCTLRLRK
jgi:Uma2 family endonuclease